MYATKQQLLNLLAILDKSCTKDDDDMDHRHGLFDSTDRGLMEDMRIELEEEIAENQSESTDKDKKLKSILASFGSTIDPQGCDDGDYTQAMESINALFNSTGE
jgi:hypothetical protein